MQLLLDVLEPPISCAVLGAGASYAMVALMRQLAAQIDDLVLQSGMFPAEPIHLDPAAEGILRMRGTKRIPPWNTEELVR